MKVGNVTERTMEAQAGGQLDTDELDRAGIDLGATGRLQLMAKLAEGEYTEIYRYCILTLVLLKSDMPCLCKQYRSILVVF